MSTQYRLVQSGKTASGSCSAGQGSSELYATDYLKGTDYLRDFGVDGSKILK
jgi:hypothetical protein